MKDNVGFTPAARLRRGCAAAAGFTYLFVMFMVLILGLTAAATGTVWRVAQQRDKEEALLYVGDEYRKAIEAYVARNPRAPQPYPRTLEDLLRDPRDLTVRRYLRKIYPDPVTGSRAWGLVRTPGGGIAGVYSLSNARPVKQANFAPAYAGFNGARRHSEWRFVVANAPVVTVAATVAPDGGAPIEVSIAPAAASSAVPAQVTVNVAALSRVARTDRTQNRCAAIRQLDAWNCAQIAAAWDQASADRCTASAAVRQEVCAGDPLATLPGLELRHF